MTEIVDRLNELTKLKDGWLDGEGSAITGRTVDIAKVFLISLSEEKWCPELFIYPTWRGGITVEWDVGYSACEIELYISDNGPSFDCEFLVFDRLHNYEVIKDITAHNPLEMIQIYDSIKEICTK